jgi:hypothetical protein
MSTQAMPSGRALSRLYESYHGRVFLTAANRGILKLQRVGVKIKGEVLTWDNAYNARISEGSRSAQGEVSTPSTQSFQIRSPGVGCAPFLTRC